MINKSLVEIFVTHGPTHSEVWDITRVEGEPIADHFLTRDGQAHSLWRSLYATREQAESAANRSYPDHYFDTVRRY